MACAVDCGTYNLVCAQRDEKGNFVYKREVNAFLEMPIENRFVFNMMKNAGVPLVERPDSGVAYALGEAAVNMAYSMSQIELKRPMKDGCLNPKEKHAQQIMSIMIHSLLDIKEDKETLYYSVPANAINEETDADYHGKILEAVFRAYDSNGDGTGKKVNAYQINEGLALIYAELASKSYTGIGISCLLPGTKIYTNKGIINIEDVVEGDLVLTHKGRWKKVFNVIEKKYNGLATKIKTGSQVYDFVENHKLFMNKRGNWEWIGSENVERGDIIGEPILQHNSKSLPAEIVLNERITSSKVIIVNRIKANHNVQRLIGYYLGDGSYNLEEGCIQFDFNIKEKDYCSDVSNILNNEFNKNASLTYRSDNCVRVKCYSRSLARWFADNIGKKINKRYPWSLEQLTTEECLHLLVGLIRSDGEIYSEQIKFGNTNTRFIFLARQLFSRLNIPTTINNRSPRKGGTINGRTIEGKLNEWCVIASQVNTLGIFEEFTSKLELNIEKCKRPRTFIKDNYCCTRIHEVDKYHYEGLVYDLQVEDDHSFSGPFLMISNCGAGMVNLCYSIFGAPIFQFSIVNSGDWIDKQAARATGESPTFINKEKMKVKLNEESDSLVQRAIKAQYEIMVQRTVTSIKKGLEKVGNKARAEQAVDVIIAGGTSSPVGFDELFEKTIKNAHLPIEIGRVVRPKDPLYSVAKGCLIAAEAAQII